MWKSATLGLLAVWLLAAPFVLPSATAHVYNNWLVGLIITNVALVMSNQRKWEMPIATAAGVWLFMSGFVPSVLSGRAAMENDILIAIALFVSAVSARTHLREEVAALDAMGVLAEDRI